MCEDVKFENVQEVREELSVKVEATAEEEADVALQEAITKCWEEEPNEAITKFWEEEPNITNIAKKNIDVINADTK